MPEKRGGTGIMAVDPEAQAVLRRLTDDYVSEMVDLIVGIARDPKTGVRDRMKAAVRIIDYNTRGCSSLDVNGDGSPAVNILVVRGDDLHAQNEAAEELRQLQAARRGGS